MATLDPVAAPDAPAPDRAEPSSLQNGAATNASAHDDALATAADDGGAAATSLAEAKPTEPHPSHAPQTLDAEALVLRRLQREILVSERLRVQILAAIPGLSLLVFLVLTATYPAVADRVLSAQMDRLRVGLLLGGFAVYELFALSGVERQLESGEEPTVLRRYANALVETSLPTCAVLYYMTVVSPVEALLLPPTFFYFVFILLSTLRLDFLLCLFTGAVAAVEYGVLALLAVGQAGDGGTLASVPHHLAKACILLVSGVAAGFVARRLRTGFVKTLESMEERGRILSLFGQHVSPAVVDRLLAESAEESRGELREVCVMFLDVRSFTRFAEGRKPEDVVAYLNALFAPFVESVHEHQGFVNKFLGDGFMAVFGAPLPDPDACDHAVAAALSILTELEAACARGDVPETRIGIGLHAGRAVVGNVGAASRKEYTVIGDVVNVASRVEALNKELGSRLLVTDEVLARAPNAPRPAATRTVSIRGREQAMTVHELVPGAGSD